MDENIVRYLDLAGLQSYDTLIKKYVNDADAKAYKTISFQNDKIYFFKKENAVVGTDTADLEVSISGQDVAALKEKLGTATMTTTAQTVTEAINELDAAVDAINAAETGILDQAKEYADKKVASVAAKDASVAVDNTDATAPKLNVAISATEGNQLTLTDDGLLVAKAPVYNMVKDENSGEFAAVYHFTKDGVNTGAAINIPKDMVVQSGEVVENPEGQEEGTYIKLVLQNVTDPLFINVGDLIEYVTSGSAEGDMVVVAVDEQHKVTATITDASITKAKLDTTVQTSLGKADSAVQKVVTGTENGTVAVDGQDVQVKGLGSAAYTASNAYDQAGAATTVKTELLGDASTATSADNTIAGVQKLIAEKIDAIKAIEDASINALFQETPQA